MNILGILGKVVTTVVPTLKKEKARVSSVDTLISKKDNASKAEIIMALGYKYARLALMAYVVISVVAGKVSLGEILKVLSLNLG